jgi:hypothetical protein
MPVVWQRAGTRPFVNGQSARFLETRYTGEPDAVAALGAMARPVSLATADFDSDGAPDLVAGYRTAEGGVVTLTRGNPDAFAPADPGYYQKAMKGQMPATFMPDATAYAVPGSPDFLATADFDRDGYKDLLVGTSDGGLYLLRGDGNGNLSVAQEVPLAARLMAMDATPDGHLAVSLDGPSGPRAVILAPGKTGFTTVASYSLPAPGFSVTWGSLGGGRDLAIGAGANVVIVYAALSANPQTETVSLSYGVRGLATGATIWNRDGSSQISVLGDDGAVHILQHGTLDTRPLTAGDVAGRREAPHALRAPQDPTMLGAWTEAIALPVTPGVAAGTAHPLLQASPLAGDGLMVGDGEQNRLMFLDASGTSVEPAGMVSFLGTPVAALVTATRINGTRALVGLSTDQAAPMVMDEAADPAVTVSTTADTDGQNACGNKSVTATSLSGTISLRTAVCAVNNSGAGTYTINVPPGTYNLTSLDTGDLQLGTAQNENISIIGSGSASNTIIQQTDGKDRIFEQDPDFIGDIPVTIENVTLTGGTCTTGTDCSYGGGAMLGGGPSGAPDNITLTNVVLSNNTAGNASQAENGGAMQLSDAGIFTFTNCTFSNNTAVYHVGGGTGGAIDVTDEANMTITNCTFTGNVAQNGGGGALYSVIAAGDTATISGSTFTGNSALDGAADGSAHGGAIHGNGDMTVSNSRIAGNSSADGASYGTGIYSSNAAPLGTIAPNNWWGCNGGPGASGCDTAACPTQGVNGPLTVSPWLVLSVTASASPIEPEGTSVLTADLTHNSSGTGGFAVPNGTAVTFRGTLGTVNPTGTTLTSGTATSVYTAASSTGTGSGTATVDNQTVSATITIVAPPAITSANSTQFVLGAAGTFTVTATGYPAPTFSETGTLPNGVALTSAGVLSGTPTGAGGTYPITITAQNGVSPNATQTFTLTVKQACKNPNPNPNPNSASFANPGDFNGDCKSDILWRNGSSEEVYQWLMSGTSILGQGSPAGPSSAWVIEGVGDFSGDGMADVLWQNSSSGEVYLWLMNGTTIANQGTPGTVSPSSGWVIQGVGDFNGDGKADILWRNSTTGDVYIWQMNGTTIASQGDLGVVSPSSGWVIQGVGDFNGDGKADILWRNTTSGEIYIWLMNGSSIASQGSPATVSPSSGWVIQGTGDFDGNGASDVVWRNSGSGEVYIWFMNGATITSQGTPGNVSSAWTIQGVGDYNGDGRADILWQNSSGEVYIWLMNGLTITSQGSPGSVSTPWQISPLMSP